MSRFVAIAFFSDFFFFRTESISAEPQNLQRPGRGKGKGGARVVFTGRAIATHCRLSIYGRGPVEFPRPNARRNFNE